MSKRLQNRIAESRFTLTITALLCLPIWGVVASVSEDIPLTGASMACVILATILIAELNNAFSLIRIYSRMMSTCFLLLMTMSITPLLSLPVAGTSLCAIIYYIAAFRCYQEPQMTGWFYLAFLAIGVNSLFFVQVLYLIPPLVILAMIKLLSMNGRMLMAALLGILTPYWFALVYVGFTQDFTVVSNHFSELITFTPPMEALGQITMRQAINGGMVALCAFIGIIHYLRNKQQDRIRTQLFYEIFITIDLLTIMFMIIQPQHFTQLMPIMIVNTAPLIAHFIALTETKWTNMLTKVLFLLLITITIYNLLSQSFLTTYMFHGLPL